MISVNLTILLYYPGKQKTGDSTSSADASTPVPTLPRTGGSLTFIDIYVKAVSVKGGPMSTIQDHEPTTIAVEAETLRQANARLDNLYNSLMPMVTFDVSSPTDRYIIFSDQHRGKRDRADDFRHSERAYNAALAYYYALGHTLVALGDVEEFWKQFPGPVVKAYKHSLELEARFHKVGRYLRIWGNHDEDWSDEGAVRKHLWPIFGEDLRVHEGVRVRIIDSQAEDGNTELGELFLIHGHQGTLDSDTLLPFSRVMVRLFYAPVQRLTGFSLAPRTPASDWERREGHNRTMYEWVRQKNNLLLIAGHTHRPVFLSLTHPDQVMREIEEVQAALEAADPADHELRKKLRQRLAALSAELEWIRAQELAQPGEEGDHDLPAKTPRYFNTGCCCFLDGKITGLELVDGQIRLIRWPDDEGKPRPKILAPGSNQSVLLRDLLVT
jgi:hypothetical protein